MPYQKRLAKELQKDASRELKYYKEYTSYNVKNKFKREQRK